MPRQKDKRADFAHAYAVAAREARAKGADDEAAILENRHNVLVANIALYPTIPLEPA